MRIRRTLTGLALLGLAAGCAPAQSGPAQAGGDEKTGTVRVWLFDEANRAPKEATVNEAIAEFKAAHSSVEVDVQWVPVEGRADKFSGAFNDPSNAPDVAEFGNTDVASYVATGAFADLTADVKGWKEGADLLPSVLDTAKVDGKVYGLPWYTGIRALYYRTDVFTELGLTPPKTLAELTTTARKIRAAKPELYGISVGGKYTYAMLPFLWANGGEIAQQNGAKWSSSLNTPAAKAGVQAYADLIKPDICPPQQCANLTGTQSVQAFSGGNLLGVFGASKKHGLAVEFAELLANAKYQAKMYTAMGNLPTLGTVQQQVAASDPFLKPFVDTLKAGTKFVPSTPAWSKIDAQGVLPTAVQQIATGGQDVDTALGAASGQMNKAFG